MEGPRENKAIITKGFKKSSVVLQKSEGAMPPFIGDPVKIRANSNLSFNTNLLCGNTKHYIPSQRLILVPVFPDCVPKILEVKFVHFEDRKWPILFFM